MRPSASSNLIISSPIFDPREGQLALLRLAANAESAGALLEEHALPGLQLVRRHLALARHGVKSLAAQQPKHQLRLPRTPALGGLRRLRRRGFTARSRLSAWALSSSTSLAAVIVVETVSTEIGSDLSE